MKLCWLIPDDRGGGVVSVALSCVRQAQADGHDATLLLLLSPSGWLAREPNNGFTLASLDLVPLASNAPAELLRWLESHPQDVLVLNGCEQFDLAIPYLPPSVGCVYAVHDTAPRYWQAAVAHETDLDAIIAISHVVARQFESRLLDPTRLRVIHNGSYFPPPPARTERLDDLLFLGGDNPTKGAWDVLRLWRQLAGEGFAGRLHWFGHCTPGFERRVRALPASERITLHGRTTRDEIFAAAGGCRVFLMLSRVEPFGMVTIEAMSMGCVPVAWDVDTGTQEIVRDGETGLFAPLGNFTELASRVWRAAREHARMAPSAQTEARTCYDEREMWAGYAPLLEAIHARRERPPRSRAGEPPAVYTPPRRRLQMLPMPLRRAAQRLLGASPRLGYWLRDRRGW